MIASLAAQLGNALHTALVHAATTPPAAPPDELVNPGWVGFAATFGLAVVVALIIMDMIRRIRRLNYREDVRKKLDQEEAIEAAEAAAREGSDQRAPENREPQ